MDPAAVLAKTPKGAEEIETRRYKLDHRSRALLIMVNGKSSVAELARKFEQIGDIRPTLEALVADGFVALAGAPAAPPAASAARPAATMPGIGDLRRAQTEIALHLRNVLGPDADSLTEKIERCRTLAELRELLEGRRAMLEEWMGKAKSAAFWARAEPLLR